MQILIIIVIQQITARVKTTFDFSLDSDLFNGEPYTNVAQLGLNFGLVVQSTGTAFTSGPSSLTTSKFTQKLCAR